MFEIRIYPQSPTEFKAVLELVQALADARQEAGGAAQRGADPGPAPLVDTPAHASALPAEVEETVTSDIPGPSSRKADQAHGPQQVFEALQDYARANGAAALKEVLDRFGARRVSDLQPEHYAEVMTIARGGMT